MARITGYTKEGLDAELDRRLGGIQEGFDPSNYVLSTDYRLTNKRIPTAHHSNHWAGGSDPLAVEHLKTFEGDAGKVLVTTGTGLVEWANISSGGGSSTVHCSVWLSAVGLTVPASTLTKVPLDLVSASSQAGMLQNNSIEIPEGQSGIYAIVGQVHWSSTMSDSGDMSVQLHRDAGEMLAESRFLARSSASVQTMTTASLAAGWRVSLRVLHTVASPGTYAVDGGDATKTNLKLWRIA